ncbi:hypothetical protein TWF970_007042 [Orbilia oligospora]|uniref:non-specific serine/threonine protein kinase n=1 Tax=Orbilia oligospora TaxID=2813651 RepID=A0A7C8VUR6_ORBOL|nr:hypothetical protein TWF970_007042 [Orbilia oligospora]
MSAPSTTGMSPAPTPPPEVPTSLAEWRFKPIPRAECIEAYRPGGYHPVHFGDLFHNGRYKIINKLGYGQYSTVWLAQDVPSSEFVALKIKTAKDSVEDQEVVVLNHLNDSRASTAGSEHVIRLKDSFYHQGPNGNHLCLVFELLGDNIYSILEDYSSEITGFSGRLTKFPMPVAKRILKEILLGLNFLHQNGVVHGDLHPGNFLSSVKGLNSLETRNFMARIREATVEVKRIDEKLDRWAPKYLAMPQPLVETNQRLVSPIKISDLGASILTSEAPTARTPVIAIGLRSPELILNSHPFDTYIDIWSFGCLMFEMLIGEKLFALMPLMPGCNIDNRNDDNLLQMDMILGPLPENLHARWARSGNYCRPGSREHYNSMIGGPEGIPSPVPNMEETVRQALPEEAEVILSLLREILNYDPLKRPSALEILKNSFWDGPG